MSILISVLPIPHNFGIPVIDDNAFELDDGGCLGLRWFDLIDEKFIANLDVGD